MEAWRIGIYLVLVVLFLLMNAFFVVAEFSIVRVRKSQIELAVEEGKKGAKQAQEIVTNVNAYLSACQLGITLASLALGWLGEPVFAALVRPIFVLLRLPEAIVPAVAIAVGYFLMTTLHVVVGELIPKSIAIFSTESYALHTSRPLMIFYRVTYPVMWLFNTITNGVVKLLGHDPSDEHDVYSGDEIKLLVDESTASGLIDPEQNEYVDNVLDLGDKDAEAIMTPRTDVTFIDINDSAEENLETINRYSYSRYPVCDGDADHLVGFVHMKDLFGIDKKTPMRQWPIRNLIAVPETCSISKMIQELSSNRTEICVVVDEHGGTAGIATLADVLEQIVGRIDDEYRHEADDAVKQQADGSFKLDGRMPIADLVELLGFEPKGSSEVETVAGLVLKLMDRIPNEGDSVSITKEMADEVIETEFEVLKMDNLRIDTILLTIDRLPK